MLPLNFTYYGQTRESATTAALLHCQHFVNQVWRAGLLKFNFPSGREQRGLGPSMAARDLTAQRPPHDNLLEKQSPKSMQPYEWANIKNQ